MKRLKQLAVLSMTSMLFLGGCGNNQPRAVQQTNNIVKDNKQTNALQQKVSKAFDDAPRLLKEHSKWYDRTEKLPLTIITTAYIDPDVIKTKEYKAYKLLVEKIQKDPSLLGSDISSKYSSIKFVDYQSSDDAKRKFNGAYNYRYDDKSTLTDILRPDIEKPSAELLIRLNLKELKKGNLTIEGYKTVKESKLKRNSYYYTLRKTGYDKLSLKEKNQAIFNSLLATLKLSIPEYVSIDRSKLVKDGEILRFITPNGNGSYTGEVWKYANEEMKNISKVKQNFMDEFKKTNKILKTVDFEEYKKHIKIKKTTPSIFKISKNFKNYNLTVKNKQTGEQKTLIGHEDIVDELELSKDENYLLSGDRDGVLIYWDLKTLKKIYTLKEHDSEIENLYITEDGKYAFSQEKDTTEFIQWDLKNGKVVQKIDVGYKFDKFTISDNKQFAYKQTSKFSVTPNVHKFFIISLSDNSNAKMLSGYETSFQEVAFTNDKKYMISGDEKGVLLYWDLKTRNIISKLDIHRSEIDMIKISPNDRYCITNSVGNDKADIVYWDLKTKEAVSLIKSHKITSIDPTLNYLSIVDIKKLKGLDRKSRWKEELKNRHFVKLDTKTLDNYFAQLKEKINKLYGLLDFRETINKQIIFTLPVSKEMIATFIKNNYLNGSVENTIIDIDKLTTVLDQGFDDPILTTEFLDIYGEKIDSRNKKIQNGLYQINPRPKVDLSMLYLNSKITLNDKLYSLIYKDTKVNFNKENPIILNGHFKHINSVDISSNGKYGLSAAGDWFADGKSSYDKKGNNIRYWDLNGQETLKTLEGHILSVNSVVFSKDERYALSGSKDKTLRYWDLNSGKTLKVLKGHKGSIKSVAISPDGKYALSGSEDKTLRYWNLKTGKLLNILKGHTDKVNTVSISDDGRYALSASNDRTFIYWDLKSGQKIKTFTDSERIYFISFMKNNKYVVSGGFNGNILIWDIKGSKPIKTIKAHKSAIKSIALSKNGKYMLSSSFDNTLKLWNIEKGELISSLNNTDHYSGTTAVSINDDGKYALTGSGGEHLIRYWDLGLEEFKSKEQ